MGHVLGLLHEHLALLDAKAVLFVNDDQSEFVEVHAFLDERMRADNDIDLAVLKRLE